MGFGTASLKLKLAVLFAFLAVIAHVIGFATDSWKRTSLVRFGLWRRCDGIGNVWTCRDYNFTDSHMLAVRAMETIGLILLGLVLVVGLLFLCIDGLRRKPVWIFLVIGSFLAVLSITIGVAVFAAQEIKNTGQAANYSFYLAAGGGALALLAGLTFVCCRPR